MIDRPNPDQLLNQLRLAQENAERGKLRIYVGASAGVGKTFAMLTAAHQAQQEGRKVVIGIVEHHGRLDTLALVHGLIQLPLRKINYRGHTLDIFDLDAALDLKPDLLLVDELAHSNIEGARHPKRWQDVDELLAAGINIWATLNVQHLESVNDVIAGITGIKVYETLPDTVLALADELVMVDVPVDELLDRLKSGKIYPAEQARKAEKNFFRKGNLIALREIALRRIADHIEGEVKNYRIQQSITPVWKTDSALLACIGPGAKGEYVIRNTARLAAQLNIKWHVAYVETPSLQRLAPHKREHILKILKLAEDLGAVSAVLSGSDIARVIIHYAQQNNISKVVIGKSIQAWRLKAFFKPPLSLRLAALSPEMDVISLGQIKPLNPEASQPSDLVVDTKNRYIKKVSAYVYAVIACLLTTSLATPLYPYFDLANIVMLFLLSVVLIAVKYGRSPAILAAFLNVAAFDFFFVQPRFSFAVSDVQYLMTFLVMLVVGLITGQLTAGLRYQARIALQRAERARTVFEMARQLSAALQTNEVVHISLSLVGRACGGEVALLLPDEKDRLTIDQVLTDSKQTALGDLHQDSSAAVDIGIAQWAFDNVKMAGFATDTLPANLYRYLPLKAPMRVRGVLAIKPLSRRWLLIPEHQRQLDTFANLIAIALERVHYVSVAQDALLKIESEYLRNTLLSTLSHDLRTPLTVLSGLVDSLKLNHSSGLSNSQMELVNTIYDQTIQMNAWVSNLLDIARIESGGIKLKLDWQLIQEVIDTAIKTCQPFLKHHKIQLDFSAELPLVQFDSTLIERVLINLLENAAKYAPQDTVITIAARAEQGYLYVSVSDQGPGLPSGMEEAVFEKFMRLHPESSKPGIGIGLSICRAIIQTHQGKIIAHNLPHGGLKFTFSLPLGIPPTIDLKE